MLCTSCSEQTNKKHSKKEINKETNCSNLIFVVCTEFYVSGPVLSFADSKQLPLMAVDGGDKRTSNWMTLRFSGPSKSKQELKLCLKRSRFYVSRITRKDGRQSNRWNDYFNFPLQLQACCCTGVSIESRDFPGFYFNTSQGAPVTDTPLAVSSYNVYIQSANI